MNLSSDQVESDHLGITLLIDNVSQSDSEIIRFDSVRGRIDVSQRSLMMSL